MKRHHWLLLAGLVILAVVLFAFLLILTAAPSIAPTKPSAANLDDATMRVASQLYCPVCPNTPLDVCETQACQQWRDLIKAKLTAGQTPEQIKQYFVSEYGERVLGAPQPQGFNLGIYIIPVVAVIAGAGIIMFVARQWQRERDAATAQEAPEAPGEEYRDRIESDLHELDR